MRFIEVGHLSWELCDVMSNAHYMSGQLAYDYGVIVRQIAIVWQLFGWEFGKTMCIFVAHSVPTIMNRRYCMKKLQ